jgi:hypothetical protein
MREDILVIAIAGVDAGQQKSWRRPQGGAKWNTAPVIDRSGNRFDYRPPQRAVSLPLKS